MAASRPVHLTMSHSHSLLFHKTSLPKPLERLSISSKASNREPSCVLSKIHRSLKYSVSLKSGQKGINSEDTFRFHHFQNLQNYCSISKVSPHRIRRSERHTERKFCPTGGGGRRLLTVKSSFLEASDIQGEEKEREGGEETGEEASLRPWLTRPRRTSVSYLEISNSYNHTEISNTDSLSNNFGSKSSMDVKNIPNFNTFDSCIASNSNSILHKTGNDIIINAEKLGLEGSVHISHTVSGDIENKSGIRGTEIVSTCGENEGNFARSITEGSEESGDNGQEVREGMREEEKGGEAAKVIAVERGDSSWVWRGRKKVKNVFPLNVFPSPSNSPSPPPPLSSPVSPLPVSSASSSLPASPPSPASNTPLAPLLVPASTLPPSPSSSTPSPPPSPSTQMPSNSSWFPYANVFDLGLSKPLTSEEVVQLLDPFMMEGRRERMERVVSQRTYSIVPVVEGLADLGNVSAVCRTAEAFGFQSVHVISSETKRRFKDNRNISMGTDKWLDVELWEKCDLCLETLKNRGYRIAATHISPDTIPIYDIDWTIPTAIIFGNEHRGVSAKILENSDIRCSIPMSGMVDSFNISVAAAISMHEAVRDRIRRQGFHGDLTEEQQQILVAEFMLRHNRHTKCIIEQLLTQKGVELGQNPKRPFERFLQKAAAI